MTRCGFWVLEDFCKKWRVGNVLCSSAKGKLCVPGPGGIYYIYNKKWLHVIRAGGAGGVREGEFVFPNNQYAQAELASLHLQAKHSLSLCTLFFFFFFFFSRGVII